MNKVWLDRQKDQLHVTTSVQTGKAFNNSTSTNYSKLHILRDGGPNPLSLEFSHITLKNVQLLEKK